MIEEEDIDRVFRELRRRPFNADEVIAIVRGVTKHLGHPWTDEHEMLVDAALKETIGWSMDEMREQVKKGDGSGARRPAEILLMLRIRK